MPSLKLWDGMSLNWGQKANFEEFASEAVPVLEKLMTRDFVVAIALFIAGLVAIYYESIGLGAVLLLLALHYDQQSNKSHMLLVLTAYHRASMRLLEAQTTEGHLAEKL